jgi:hypothetical protein
MQARGGVMGQVTRGSSSPSDSSTLPSLLLLRTFQHDSSLILEQSIATHFLDSGLILDFTTTLFPSNIRGLHIFTLHRPVPTMSSSMPIPKRKQPARGHVASWSWSSSVASSCSTPSSSSPAPMLSLAKGKFPTRDEVRRDGREEISPRRPSLLGRSSTRL